MGLPLEGVRIVEMGQLIAIPHAIKMLADMGAQVIRVESCVRVENYRASSFYHNTADGPYWNRTSNFNEQNRNKLSLTLELTKPEGLDALKDAISVSDVFAENFTPRVMKNFGLEYEDLRKIKPDIIMVSSTGYGYTGPWANFGAIGPATEAASGLAYATGYRDGPPAIPEMPYTDYTAAEHTVFAVMSALIHRAKTGQGQFIDVSQTQAASSTVPEILMDFAVNGRTRERIGNQDLVMAPHGCYQCRGDDRWIAIAIADDLQWNALCKVLDKPAWGEQERFGDALSRWRNRDELDGLIGQATVDWDQHDLMDALQSRGVAAGVVVDNKQLLYDAHLRHRGFYEFVAHHADTEMPSLPYSSRPWNMSRTSGSIRTHAPLMGQHNRYVLCDVLGRSIREFDQLETEGVIGDRPAGDRQPTVVPLEHQMRQGRVVRYEPDFDAQVQILIDN